jgi:tight adherence protein B
MNLFVGTLIVLFVVSILAIELCLFAFRAMRGSSPDPRRLRRRLSRISSNPSETTDILRKQTFSSVPVLNAILSHTPGTKTLDLLLRQADIQQTPSVFLMTTALLSLAGYVLTWIYKENALYSIIVAVLLGVGPYLYVRQRKGRRMDKFQAQLPDGLELIARALRAGHAFTTGMKIAADNFGDPIGPEFADTLDEINFGVSIPDALKNLARRVDCPDLKFFVVSVILQRETGGNLAEIIETIARIIRERFKFQDKVRVLSAEGNLSAKILICLPFLIVISLRFINPDYANVLMNEKSGQVLGSIAIVMMIIGIYLIMKMVKIRV